MRLSDQIELLRETLENHGYVLGDGQSVGEGAAQIIEHLEGEHRYPHMCRDGHPEIGYTGDDETCPVCRWVQHAYDADEAKNAALERIAELESMNDTLKRELALADKALEHAQPSTDGLCDSCTYLKDAALPRLCVNQEAWRQGFSRRGYSVKAGHACELWTGR